MRVWLAIACMFGLLECRFSGSSQFAVLYGGNEKVPEDSGVEW